jgi:uncharacterized membrane protein
MAPEALQFANLWLVGMLVGQEFSTQVAVNPAARALPVPCQVTFQQSLARRYKGLGPLLFFSTLGTAVALAVTIDAAGRGYAIAGSACLLAMVVLTFAGNMPVNLWTFEQTGAVDPAEWATRRRRWDRFHEVRVLLDSAAFACFLLALLKIV